MNSIMQLSEIGSTSKVPRFFMMAVSCLCALRILVMVMEEVQALPEVTLVQWHTPGELSATWRDSIWRKRENSHESKLIAGGHVEREPAPPHETQPVVEGNVRPFLMEFVTPACLHSKQLDMNVLRGREVSELINGRFYPVRVEFTGRKRSIETGMLVKYRVAQVPTLIVTNENGEEVSRLTGYKSGTTVYRFLTSALAANSRARDEAAKNEAQNTPEQQN